MVVLMVSNLFITVGFFISSKENYTAKLIVRYIMVTEGKMDFDMKDDPKIFTRSEVFDLSTLNFLLL